MTLNESFVFEFLALETLIDLYFFELYQNILSFLLQVYLIRNLLNSLISPVIHLLAPRLQIMFTLIEISIFQEIS